MKRTIEDIAKQNGVTPRTVHYLKSGKRHTALHYLAIDIASITGKRPIDYIRPSLRKIYKKVMPQLLIKGING